MDQSAQDLVLSPILSGDGAVTPAYMIPLDLFQKDEYIRRAPNWRLTRIIDLISNKAKPVRGDDGMVCSGYRFLSAYLAFNQMVEGQDRVGPELRRSFRRLGRQYPFISSAFQLYLSGTLERFSIEALICAKAPPEFIADEVSGHALTVEAYEKLFFDVRSRLNARMWVAVNVLRPILRRGFNAKVIADFVWKTLAYYMGVEGFLEFVGSGQIGKERREQWDEIVRSQITRDAALSSLCQVITPYNGGEVIDRYLTMQAQEAETAGRQVSGKTAEGVDILMQAIAFSVASMRGETRTPIEERPFQSLNRLAGRGFFAKEAITAQGAM